MTIAEQLIRARADYDAVYEAGFEAGKQSGGDSHYDTFWDTFQKNGERTDYNFAFVQDYWSLDNFKPKYDLNVVKGTQMFYYNTVMNVDLKQLLQDLGIKLITSGLTNAQGMFQNTRFKVIPTLDFRNTTNTTSCFISCISTNEIEKLLVSENTPFSNAFSSANNLKKIQFEGVIGKSINLQWSPLYVDSMKSIISCLKDFTGTGNEYTCSIKFREDCWIALEADSTAPDGGTWQDYVEKLGWTT